MIEQLQRTAKWQAARMGRITGSRAAAALGTSPWMKPDDLIREMVREYHGYPSERERNPALDYGNRHEQAGILKFMREMGLHVEPVGFLTIGERYGASPDGKVSDGSVLELKVPFKFRYVREPEFQKLKEQPHYYPQVQFEMKAANTKHAWFAQYAPAYGDVFDPDFRDEIIVVEPVEYDAEWWDENLPKLDAFYERYLSELDNKAHLEPKRVEIDTMEARAVVDRISEIDEALGQLGDERKDLMQRLIAMADEKDALVCGRKLTKVVRRGNVQYAKLLKEHPIDVDVEQYRGKESVSWRLI